MKNRIKIVFFIHQLNSGGSQKVILNIIRNLNKKRFDIVLVVINNIGELSSFSHPDVQLIDLKTKKIRNSLLKIFAVIRQEEPDIVFSGLSFLSLIFSCLIPFKKFLLFKKDILFIARETNTLSISNKTQSFTILRNFLYKTLYKNFDKIICQSRYMQKDLIENYNVPLSKTIVINNPVDILIINKKLLESKRKKLYNSNKINLIAIGRLHYNKGFDLLLQVLSKLDLKYHLTILGDGKEKESLLKLSEDLGLSERVDFLGFKSNPYIYMEQADLFVLSSRHEGFPNVVLEANACGTPVVAFQCPGVSEEVIQNGLNGFLVRNDINSMKESIEDAVDFSWDKEKIKSYIIENFSSQFIIKKYEKVFSTLVEKGSSNE